MKIIKNHNIKCNNTFAVEAFVSEWIEFENVDELGGIPYREDKFLFMGSGSNMLFRKDFDGTVLHSSMKEITMTEENDEHVIIETGSGVIWDDFVKWSLEKKYFGLENLSAIPGTTGSSAVQNIGAYGSEAADFIHKVNVYDFETKMLKTLSHEDCNFSYRNSIFKTEEFKSCVITSVFYKLHKRARINLSYGVLKERFKDANPSPEEVGDFVRKIRKEKLPDVAKQPNAGSFFKNPVVSKDVFDHVSKKWDDVPFFETEEPGMVKIPAAWLIEKAGFKGRQIGNVKCHDTQPLVIINRGVESGEEIVIFSKLISEKVYEMFGIKLEPEVRFIPA